MNLFVQSQAASLHCILGSFPLVLATRWHLLLGKDLDAVAGRVSILKLPKDARICFKCAFVSVYGLKICLISLKVE